MLSIPQMTRTGAAIQKAITAISASQFSSSSSPINDTIRSQNRIFAGYVFVSFLVLLGTILLFRSSGRVQDAIKSDADARIKGADERIKQVESSANERIKTVEANARLRIEEIEDARAKAKRQSDEKIAGLEKDAVDSRRATEELRIKSEMNLEAERRKRLSLAVSLLPRNFRDQSGAIAALVKERVGMTAEFEVVEQDKEALSLAQQIYFVLTNAGWRLSKRTSRIPFRDGLSVHWAVSPAALGPSATPQQMFMFQRWAEESRKAAESLRIALVNSGLEAVMGPPEKPSAPINRSVVIRVGPKPNRVLEEALSELGEIPPTPVGGMSMGGNRDWFKQ